MKLALLLYLKISVKKYNTSIKVIRRVLTETEDDLAETGIDTTI